jgi:hypothetical protein
MILLHKLVVLVAISYFQALAMCSPPWPQAVMLHFRHEAPKIERFSQKSLEAKRLYMSTLFPFFQFKKGTRKPMACQGPIAHNLLWSEQVTSSQQTQSVCQAFYTAVQSLACTRSTTQCRSIRPSAERGTLSADLQKS